MASFSRTVVRNSAFGFAAQFATKIASFAFNVLVVRQLGPELFGQYSAINAFGATFIFIADLGLSIYAIRQIAMSRDAAENPESAARLAQFNGNLLALRLVLSVIASVVMLAFATLTGRPTTMLMGLGLVATSWVLYAFQGSYAAILGGFERLDVSSRAQIIYQLLFVALGAIAVLALGMGYVALIAANVISIALLTFLCWRGVRSLNIKIGRPNPAQWPNIIRACIPFGIVTLALGLSYKFDSVLLNLTRSDAETGYYGAAYNLVFYGGGVLECAEHVAVSIADSSRGHFAGTNFRASTSAHMRYLLLVSIPIAVAVWALSEQLVPFLFKAQFAPAVDALRILIWVVPFMYVSEFLGYVVLISGNEKKVARSVGISTLINIGFNMCVSPSVWLCHCGCHDRVHRDGAGGAICVAVAQAAQSDELGAAPCCGRCCAAVAHGRRARCWCARCIPVVRQRRPRHAPLSRALLLLLGVVGKDELRFVQSLRRKEAPAV